MASINRYKAFDSDGPMASINNIGPGLMIEWVTVKRSRCSCAHRQSCNVKNVYLF